MPASSRSLQLTDIYRERLLAVRSRVERETESRWPAPDAPDLDQAFAAWLHGSVTAIVTAQAEVVRATAGYLTAFATSETGRRAAPVDVQSGLVGFSRDGRPIADALQSPLIAFKAGLKRGDTLASALEAGRVRAVRAAGFDVDQAARTAVLKTLQGDDRFAGWQRAVRGTCGACLAAADGPQSGERFETHPNCQCVPEPLVSQPPPGFGATVKKNDRVEVVANSSGQELRGTKWAPIQINDAIRGRVMRTSERDVLLNAGTTNKPRWVQVPRGNLAPIERKSAQAASEAVEQADLAALPKIEPALKGQKLRDALAQPKEMFAEHERTAIRDYTGAKKTDIAEQLNRSLRKETFGPRSKWADVKEGLDAAFDRVEPLQEPGLVFRGAKPKFLRSLKPGAVIEDKGYMSTSPSRTVANNFAPFNGAIFEVVLPKGAKALDINEAAGSAYGFERETLLPRGTKMVIESIKDNPKKPSQKIIRARVLL